LSIGTYFVVRRLNDLAGGADSEDMPLFARAPKDIPQTPDKWKLSLEGALRVSEIAASAAALPEAVQGMVEVAIDMMRAENGSIMLLEDDGRNLVLVASYGLPTDVPAGFTMKVGESVAGRVLATGKPLLLNEVEEDAFVNFIPKDRPISSSVVVPLRVQGRAIGVLNLAISASSALYDEEDLRVAQMFADQAAGVIYRARLHEAAEHRSSDLMALVESSRGLLGDLDVESLLQHVLDGTARLAGTNEGFACLFDPDSDAISHGIFRGIEKSAIKVLLEGDEVKRAVETVDVSLFESEGLGTLAAMGLRTAQRIRGVVVVRSDPEIIEDRRHLLRAFGQQCDTALGAAELYSEVGRKETELVSIIHGVPNPIVLVDARGRIVAVNPAAEQLFSISAAFSAGATATEIIGHSEVSRLLSGEGDVKGEVIAGNPPRTYKVRVNDVHVPGAPMGRVLLMDDVTSEREIVQTQRDFVAMIGHELRTPLTIIKGFAKTLLKRVETVSVDDAREALTAIEGRAVQLERLIEDLLYVSRIEAREASLRIEQVELRPMAQAIVEEIVGEHADREVELNIPSDLKWPCDETKIGLVLRHLVENALKYSDAPAPVIVRATDDAEELRFDVVDRGIGLVSSDIPRIFERFRQVDASSTREHGGTGVGLYLCAQLVRMHEGRIWADSTWGKGSTFSFALPRRTVSSDVVRIRNRDKVVISGA
jgi:signal transduction histidine kinase/putative methionine-R-sulfoxide reductase with GAF domain